MKDKADKKTQDLLASIASPGARRQAAYAQRQRELGRRQRSLWLTDGEAEKVNLFIENKLRK